MACQISRRACVAASGISDTSEVAPRAAAAAAKVVYAPELTWTEKGCFERGVRVTVCEETGRIEHVTAAHPSEEPSPFTEGTIAATLRAPAPYGQGSYASLGQ